jgi:hypothetical protein
VSFHPIGVGAIRKPITITMKTKPKKVWTTYDLGVAAALLCLGYDLYSLDRTNARKVLFVFRHATGIDDKANAYVADRLELNARAFFDQLKALKNRLYGD